MNRDMLINFIPKPSNEDVIIYDTSLKVLIDVDVMVEYKNLLPVFNLYSEQFLKYKNNIEHYKQMINDIYLFKTNWSEEDYLYSLQNAKKTYATLFNPIKKLESNITMLQKKVNNIEDKIKIQIAKENKEIEEKKKNIDKKINQNVDNLISLKKVYATLKIEKDQINESLKDNEEDFKIIQGIIEDIKNGKCKCRYCNSVLPSVSKNSKFYKRTYKNLEENKKELEELLEKKKINDEKINAYEQNIKNIKEELKNDSNFKAEDYNFYHKKSIEVLKLEGQRDSILNNINDLQKELKNNPQYNSKQFSELKDKIQKYELSLENLQKIKEIKKENTEKLMEYDKLENKLAQMKIKMDQYKKFLTIFFKIYEQKAAEFCGKDFKFKIFDFDNYSLIEKFEIYYKTVEYNNLTSTVKRKVEKILEEKFVFYN